MKKQFGILLVLFAISSLISLSSCTRKNYKYIEAKGETSDTTTYFKNPPPIYRLQPQDILNITILTTDPKINRLFSVGQQGSNFNQSTNGGSFYLSGFTLTNEGEIEIPIVGKINLLGETLQDAQAKIRKETKKLLPNALVHVKLVSFKITFLGEVAKKGPIYIYQDKINILEALGRVAGITDYGDKANLLIVRPTEVGQKIIRIDVSDRELLASENFFLYPEDIVIVEPIKSKIFRLNVSDYMLIVSTAVSTLTTGFLILNLVK